MKANFTSQWTSGIAMSKEQLKWNRRCADSPVLAIYYQRAATCDFQQCGILTSVDTETSLCGRLLSLETPYDVRPVA